jgi:2-amino-4-hydroxy-6-hydroxymethyldihydropteridine diphosphokinase
LSIAYISIGSNLGDRLGYIREAVKKINQSKEVRICKASSVYETQPVEYRVKDQGSRDKEQPWFLNMVLKLETNLEPLNLLELLSGIEKQMGRTRSEDSSRRKRTGSPNSLPDRRYESRNIDLDLLLYDDLVLNSERLTLPHPRMHERRFVLVPLAEISPKVIHPLLKKSVEGLMEELFTDFEKDEFSARGGPASGEEVRLYSKAL